MQYTALYITEPEPKVFKREITQLDTDNLPAGDVLIRVQYAGLNYKDALSATGHKGITRKFPFTPGVDAAGYVEQSTSPKFKPGDPVLVNGFDLGMNTMGGFGAYIRVPEHWVIPMPEGMSAYESMIIGTAGFTAALSLYKMEMNGQHPDMGPILVTGSTGGVGSMAVTILAGAGYKVIASTGKTDAHDYLRQLGATEIVDRSVANDDSGKPLLAYRWAGAIDTVGGNTLVTCLKACDRNGSVAVTGLVDTPFFNASVYPFILNGVNLLGIETAETPVPIRHELWRLLATKWKPANLETIGQKASLQELNDIWIDTILAGKTRGRIVVCHE